MNKPQTTWIYNQVSEVDRILQALHNTSNGFYGFHNFLVLPYEVAGNPQVIFLPDLDFSSNLIKKASQFGDTIPVTYDKKLIKQIVKKLEEKDLKISQNLLSKKEEQWGEKEDQFWQIVSTIFPWVKIKNLEIQISQFGSLASFYCSDSDLKIVIRADMDISHIAEAILSGILSKRLEEEDFSWQEREAVIDSLISIGPFSKLFPNYKNTLKIVKHKESHQLKLDSQKYLQKLGLDTNVLLELKGEDVYFNKKIINHFFTGSELALLKYLLIHKNCICSFDELGDVLWTEESDDFSLWALSKKIQRIRQNLEKLGISPEIIQTKRKQGYILVN